MERKKNCCFKCTEEKKTAKESERKRPKNGQKFAKKATKKKKERKKKEHADLFLSFFRPHKKHTKRERERKHYSVNERKKR
tara:strand:- start:55 stop:297 length:243 start_codon:yes stop_codon:yes gene_type:complete